MWESWGSYSVSPDSKSISSGSYENSYDPHSVEDGNYMLTTGGGLRPREESRASEEEERLPLSQREAVATQADEKPWLFVDYSPPNFLFPSF